MNARTTALITAVALLLQSANARADTTPPAGLTDPRIRTAIYRADDVFRLTGQVGYQIDLEFAPDEHFVGLAAGDMEGITFETTANHLFIKPKTARLSTNLTILTDHHAYHLDYRATPRAIDPTRGSPIYAVRFLYPDDDARQTAAQAQARAATERLSAAFNTPKPAINLDYAYCGPATLRPDAASDDGVQTRLSFAARSELPAIFVRNDDGAESLVNFTVTADALLIHRIARQFILRRGQLVGCIVNRHFDGSGERLPAGTTAPGITRDTATVR